MNTIITWSLVAVWLTMIGSAMPIDDNSVVENIGIDRIGSMRPSGKRSLALGRFSLRPGKRSTDFMKFESLIHLFPIGKHEMCGIAEMSKIGNQLDHLIPYMEQYIDYLQRCSHENEYYQQQQLN